MRPRRSVAGRTVAGVLVVLAVVLVALTATTLTLANRVVETQLQDRLGEVWQRTAGFLADGRDDPDTPADLESLDDLEGPGARPEVTPGEDPGEAPDPLGAPGVPLDSVTLVIDADGTVDAGHLTVEGETGAMSDDDAAVLAALAERVEQGDQGDQGEQSESAAAAEFATERVELSTGRYLVRVAAVERSQQVETLVVGVSTVEADTTVATLLSVQVAGGALALLAVGGLGWWWTRRELTPLGRVADAAVQVAQAPMSAGAVELVQHRVPADLEQRRDEIGDVGSALNTLIDSVDAALSARNDSERRLRAFVADASHELRTPLAAMRGYAEMLQLSEPLSPAGRDHLDRVMRQSGRMSDLVESLLLLARLDAADHDGPERGHGVQPASPPGSRRAKPVDLGELVVDAAMDAHAAGREHDWTTAIPEEPVLISADAEQLRQLVANLLTNARRHTPAGTTVEISLHVEPEGPPGQSDQSDHPARAVLRVADNGPGIPDDVARNVFDRFVRGDAARSSAEGSTGLGLAIVRSVAQAHGGDVVVETRPGSTVFTVTLPLAAPNTTGEDSDLKE
ncbi:MAG: sensor histidine kinase [Micrococcaceae bacterium]